MMPWLASNWMVALVGAVLYLAATFFCFTTASFPKPPAAQADDAAMRFVESWHFQNPELDRMLEELRQEREALAERAKELQDLEARLHSERQEIGTVTQAVFQLQRELDASVQRIRQEEIPNLKKLARLYASMSPEGSATLFKELSDEEVAKVLFYLKPAESGPILEVFAQLGTNEARRAAQLTARLRYAAESTPAD